MLFSYGVTINPFVGTYNKLEESIVPEIFSVSRSVRSFDICIHVYLYVYVYLYVGIRRSREMSNEYLFASGCLFTILKGVDDAFSRTQYASSVYTMMQTRIFDAYSCARKYERRLRIESNVSALIKR